MHSTRHYRLALIVVKDKSLDSSCCSEYGIAPSPIAFTSVPVKQSCTTGADGQGLTEEIGTLNVP